MLGVGPAVHAGKSAGSGHFPGDSEGSLIKIGTHHAFVMVLSFSRSSFG